MPHRIFYREREDGSSVELVDLAPEQADVFKLRIDRPGVAAVSIVVSLEEVEDLGNAAWQAHEGRPNPPVLPDKAFGGSDPE